MANKHKGAFNPRGMVGHVSSNRKPGMSKKEYSGPKPTKPNFSPKVHGGRAPNHSNKNKY